jgi:hypothetical protein
MEAQVTRRDPKVQYLRDELYGLTLQATVQRAHIYSPSAPSDARTAFQHGLLRALNALEPLYVSRVADDEHVAHIAALADNVSREHADALHARRFRIGPAQKALNLHLKYLWCLGVIHMPPHCPFDARIIELLPRPERLTWTQLDDIDKYRGLVAAAQRLAGSQPLAEWELHQYSQVSTAAKRHPTTT